MERPVWVTAHAIERSIERLGMGWQADISGCLTREVRKSRVWVQNPKTELWEVQCSFGTVVVRRDADGDHVLTVLARDVHSYD